MTARNKMNYKERVAKRKRRRKQLKRQKKLCLLQELKQQERENK